MRLFRFTALQPTRIVPPASILRGRYRLGAAAGSLSIGSALGTRTPGGGRDPVHRPTDTEHDALQTAGRGAKEGDTHAEVGDWPVRSPRHRDHDLARCRAAPLHDLRHER